MLVEVSEHGLRMRENVVLRDGSGQIRAWGSVHDRSVGRMLFVHIVERDLPDELAGTCSDVLIEWAVGQAKEVGRARAAEADTSHDRVGQVQDDGSTLVERSDREAAGDVDGAWVSVRLGELTLPVR